MSSDKSLKAAGIDKRIFEQGNIYLADNEGIVFPDDKLFPKRKQKKDRPVVVVYNYIGNHNPLYPLVVIAPLSTVTSKKREMDLELDIQDGVKSPCLLRLGLIQPILKIDLRGPVGKLSQDAIDRMLSLCIHLLGVTMEEY